VHDKLILLTDVPPSLCVCIGGRSAVLIKDRNLVDPPIEQGLISLQIHTLKIVCAEWTIILFGIMGTF